MSKKLIAWLGAALVVVVIIILVSSPRDSSTGTLTVVSWGGALQDAEREAFFKPFGDEHGVKVNDISFTGEYAKIKLQVENKQVIWDVVEVDADIVHFGSKENLLEPIDYDVVPKDQIIPEARNDYGVGVFFVSTALMWNESKLPKNTPPPSSWKDLFDLKKYPGIRGLRGDPRSTIEIALLADGVNADSLYPLDVDRALKKLSSIKNKISWWSSGTEFQQKMATEYVISSGWNGRFWILKKEGIPVEMSFNQGVLDLDFWIIPRGTPRKDLAMKFLASTVKPERQRLLAEKMGYGPINNEAAKALPDSLRRRLPSDPENLMLHVKVDSKWWAENQTIVREKWEKWLLER